MLEKTGRTLPASRSTATSTRPTLLSAGRLEATPTARRWLAVYATFTPPRLAPTWPKRPIRYALFVRHTWHKEDLMDLLFLGLLLLFFGLSWAMVRLFETL